MADTPHEDNDPLPEFEHPADGSPVPAVGPDADPDQAWKALGLVNDWIKHADAKVGATLAASGVVAVMLYNLVKNQYDTGFWLSLLAVACAVATACAGASSALALMPRLTIETKWERYKGRKAAKQTGIMPPDEPEEDPVNLLFFSNVAKQYDGDGPSYIEVLRSLTANREGLTRQIAHQVHANATVAHRKFTWADRSIKFIVAAFGLLGLVAIIVGLKG